MDSRFDSSHSAAPLMRKIENAAAKPQVKDVDTFGGDWVIKADDLVNKDMQLQLTVYDKRRIMFGKKARRDPRSANTSYINIDSHDGKGNDELPDLPFRSFSIDGMDHDSMPKVKVHASSQGANVVYEVRYDNQRRPIEVVKHQPDTTFVPSRGEGITYRLFAPADLKNNVYVQLRPDSFGHNDKGRFTKFDVALKRTPENYFNN